MQDRRADTFVYYNIMYVNLMILQGSAEVSLADSLLAPPILHPEESDSGKINPIRNKKVHLTSQGLYCSDSHNIIPPLNPRNPEITEQDRQTLSEFYPFDEITTLLQNVSKLKTSAHTHYTTAEERGTSVCSLYAALCSALLVPVQSNRHRHGGEEREEARRGEGRRSGG